jgi:aquaporin rerated protein, other eukaryote
MAVDQTATVAMNNGQNSSQTIIYISLGYGFSLLITAWTMYRISGGLFNPAVSMFLISAFRAVWC